MLYKKGVYKKCWTDAAKLLPLSLKNTTTKGIRQPFIICVSAGGTFIFAPFTKHLPKWLKAILFFLGMLSLLVRMLSKRFLGLCVKPDAFTQIFIFNLTAGRYKNKFIEWSNASLNRRAIQKKSIRIPRVKPNGSVGIRRNSFLQEHVTFSQRSFFSFSTSIIERRLNLPLTNWFLLFN